MTSPPHIKVNTHQSIELSRKNYWSGCNIINGSSTANPTGKGVSRSNSDVSSQYIRCSGSRGFKSARERWWYMAFSRCSNDSLVGTAQLNAYICRDMNTFVGKLGVTLQRYLYFNYMLLSNIILVSNLENIFLLMFLIIPLTYN